MIWLPLWHKQESCYRLLLLHVLQMIINSCRGSSGQFSFRWVRDSSGVSTPQQVQVVFLKQSQKKAWPSSCKWISQECTNRRVIILIQESFRSQHKDHKLSQSFLKCWRVILWLEFYLTMVTSQSQFIKSERCRADWYRATYLSILAFYSHICFKALTAVTSSFDATSAGE